MMIGNQTKQVSGVISPSVPEAAPPSGLAKPVGSGDCSEDHAGDGRAGVQDHVSGHVAGGDVKTCLPDSGPAGRQP